MLIIESINHIMCIAVYSYGCVFDCIFFDSVNYYNYGSKHEHTHTHSICETFGAVTGPVKTHKDHRTSRTNDSRTPPPSITTTSTAYTDREHELHEIPTARDSAITINKQLNLNRSDGISISTFADWCTHCDSYDSLSLSNVPSDSRERYSIWQIDVCDVCAFDRLPVKAKPYDMSQPDSLSLPQSLLSLTLVKEFIHTIISGRAQNPLTHTNNVTHAYFHRFLKFDSGMKSTQTLTDSQKHTHSLVKCRIEITAVHSCDCQPFINTEIRPDAANHFDWILCVCVSLASRWFVCFVFHCHLDYS